MKKRALFVGVNEYADGNIASLRWAVNDATELAGFFRHRAGFERAEALPNPRNRDEVLARVEELTRELGAGDEFVFFFAGHGFTVKNNHLLVCSGDRYGEVAKEWAGLPLEMLKLRTAGAYDRIVLLDACRTDLLAGRRGAASGMASGTRDLILGAAGGGGGGEGRLTVLCSCDEGQTAAEIAEKRHGVFSLAMLELLEEEAQGGWRVEVSDDFQERVGERMRKLAAEAGLQCGQRPQKMGPRLTLMEGRDRSQELGIRSQELGRRSQGAGVRWHGGRGEADTLAELARLRAEVERLSAGRAGGRAAETPVPPAVPVLPAGRRAGETKRIVLPGGAEMELAWCPPGEFKMGSPEREQGRYRDEAQHGVTLTKGFWMATTPVTQRQWKSVMGSNPSQFKGSNLPVECVNWNDCAEFCRKAGVGLQLPTEAQWEYACRAGSGTAYFWGNALNGDRASCDGTYPCGTMVKGPCKQQTTPVGSYSPNAWGFYDMHGNVWEWCMDWYAPYPRGAVADPAGAPSGSTRVLRGGCWSRSARNCRSADRHSSVPSLRDECTGFRPICPAGGG